jgi:carbon monoxide dehydrogenase subunit G
MKVQQSFTVQAPVEQVWAALIDVQRVAPCLPGAELTEAGDAGTYHGTFTVKLGPTTAAYRGTLKMEDIDEAAHRATMSARGTDTRGQGGASATIVSAVVAQDDATRVDVDTEFTITGRLARFGRGGMIEDISKRLLGEFASCLQATMAGGPAAAATAPESADGATAKPAATSGAERAPAAGESEPGPSAAPPPGPRPATAAKPVNALRLVFQVLASRIRRLWARRRGR